MANKNRIYETMTRVALGPWTVRVWDSTPNPAMGPNLIIREALVKRYIEARRADVPVGAHDIATELDKFESVVAYEILDPAGNGIVIYPDWQR